jgi:hypothetical protein
MKQKLLATICSALEYLLDRGEIEVIDKIETHVRYIRPEPLINEFIVKCGKKRFRIIAEEITKSPSIS